MNLYLIERTDRVWYDQYEGAVVAAPSLGRAYEMGEALIKDNGYGPETYSFEVEFIGVATEDISVECYILKLFKAG
jgi:hypothetical protein